MDTHFHTASIAPVQLQDLNQGGDDSRHTLVDVVIIDKTGRDGLNPLVYQLEEDMATLLATDVSEVDTLLRSHENPFLLMGEMVKMDRPKKKITLSNGNTIVYQYLIMVTGALVETSSGNREEFAAGVQALLDALKLQAQVPSHFATAQSDDATLTESDSRMIVVEPTAQHSICDVEQIAQESISGNEMPEGFHFSVTSGKRLFEVQV